MTDNYHDCWECDGTGFRLVTGFFDFEDQTKSGYYENYGMECPVCHSKGLVSDTQIFVKHAGRYYKDARSDMDLSLREASKLIGISVGDLSDFERGILK